MSIDEAIKQIVDYYVEHPPVKTKYYVSNQSLAKFCDKNGYPYLAIWRRIKTLESKDDLVDSEEIILQAIKKYEDRLHINKINEVFAKLKNDKIDNINEIENICNFLKIDFENIIDLVNMDFTYNQAINMIWYFSDRKINDYKIITDKRIKDVLTLIDRLKDDNIDIEKLELYDLIGIYKSDLYDSRNEILVKQKRYIYKTIFSLCRNYQIKVSSANYEDFESEIKYYLLIMVDRTSLNIYGQIIKYMDLTVKGYFRNYLKKYKKQSNNLSLNEAKYFNDKGAKKEKERIDYVADTVNLYEKEEDNSFSKEMMQILATLTAEDLSFIMLKYQDNYNDADLASYFNLTVNEVKQKEKEILFLLKNNDSLKLLKRKLN